MKERIVYRLFIILMWNMTFLGLAQGQIQDSILPFDSYIKIVKEHHPFAYRADILLDIGDAKILKARGAFDPKISSSVDHKSFDDKNYFTLFQGGLGVPLWFGSDLNVKFDRNNGQFLNNSDFLPDQGLLGPGIDLVLGRGLFTDERRMTLQKSKLMRQGNEFERALGLNELIYQAASAYFDWQKNALKTQLIEEVLELTQVRFDITKESNLNGYSAAVDTLEAYIAVQDRSQKLLSYQEALNNARFELNNYLWQNGTEALALRDNIGIDSLALDRMMALVAEIKVNEQDLLNNHPLLSTYQNKIDVLNVENRLNRENLKPDLRLSYSPLIDFDNQIDNGSLFFDNYKMGAFFSYPIFTRKERAEVKITDLKIDDTELSYIAKRQNLQTKLDQLYNSIQYLNLQLDQLTAIVRNTRLLLEAENQKFAIGESSVFLVNSRELKYIESREKEIDLQIKILKTCGKYLSALNQMEIL